MAAALAAQHAGFGPLLRQPLKLQGGRHHQNPELRIQQFAGLSQQHQGQLGVGSPFVKLIHNHAARRGARAGQAGICLQAPQKQAAGEHLQGRVL